MAKMGDVDHPTELGGHPKHFCFGFFMFFLFNGSRSYNPISHTSGLEHFDKRGLLSKAGMLQDRNNGFHANTDTFAQAVWTEPPNNLQV